ncbi:hypothetical protein NKI32_28320 [Mesorhizobium sp. M0761]|uniref:hypothetical protein n=1 Tax=Mesorhizobium sp. M0761 TaxID=2956994 RepID=UPI00333933D8
MVARMNVATTTRRAVVLALPAVASLPLASGGASATISVLPVELQVDRIARLAHELSEALNELDGRKSFVTVYPSDYVENPVRHGDIEDAMDAADTVSPGLIDAMVSHCAASAAVVQAARQADTVALDREVSRAERRRLEHASDVERDLFMALCRYPARNDPERHDKATYLLGFCEGDELEREHVIAILQPMRPTVEEVPGAGTNGLDRRASRARHG